MNKLSYKNFEIDEEFEKSLFENAIVFFDTSSLLDFYYFSEENRKEIEEKLFVPLKSRLWIASQSEFEFLKNREKVISKPIETYNSLTVKNKGQKDSGHVEEINQLINQVKPIIATELRGHLKTLQEKTSKNNKHPFLDNFSFSEINTEIHNLEIAIDNFGNKFLEFRDTLLKKINEQKDKLQLIKSHDSILEIFENYFQVTEKFNYPQILEIVKEGELRYKNQIPPGYLDEKEKIGFQIYGDLILWKQVLLKAKELNQNVILVINDLKEDWWLLDDKKTPISPRHELIMEFVDFTQNRMWMYDINDFLYKSNKYISTTIDKQTIDDIKDITSSLSSHKADDIIDWMIDYFPNIVQIDHLEPQDDFSCDHIIYDRENDSYELTHKELHTATYTKLMFKIKKFLDYQYSRSDSNLIEEYILVIEYPSYEIAKTFFTHSKEKKTLRNLIKKFVKKNRLIVNLKENDEIKTLFDSVQMNVS